MIITARFASRCPVCSRAVSVGDKVNWTKVTKASHLACSARTGTVVVTDAILSDLLGLKDDKKAFVLRCLDDDAQSKGAGA